MPIPLAEKSVIPGKLKKTNFRTEQERLEAFCAAMTISVQAGEPGRDGSGSRGEPGPAGPIPDKIIKTVEIPVGAEEVDTGIDVESAAVNIITNAGPTDIYITGISGTVVFFSGVASSGLKLKIII